MEVQHNSCPKCGCNRLNTFAFMDKTGDHVCIECKKCRFKGPLVRTKEEAWLSWDIAANIIKKMEKEGDAMKKNESCHVCGKANMEVKQIHGENEPKEKPARIPGNVALIERAIGGLDCCLMDKPCEGCPYNDGNRGSMECISHLLKLATKLLSDYRDATVLMNAEKKVATRKSILDAAEKCVCQDRQDTHGRPEDSFGAIADLWTAYLDAGREITPVDVAQMMILLKVGRAKGNPAHADNWIDMAGYAACAGEIAAEIYGE
nr:MAG TPA: zinc-ribbon family protein [Caudoviricetes sp.]